MQALAIFPNLPVPAGSDLVLVMCVSIWSSDCVCVRLVHPALVVVCVCVHLAHPALVVVCGSIWSIRPLLLCVSIWSVRPLLLCVCPSGPSGPCCVCVHLARPALVVVCVCPSGPSGPCCCVCPSGPSGPCCCVWVHLCMQAPAILPNLPVPAGSDIVRIFLFHQLVSCLLTYPSGF